MSSFGYDRLETINYLKRAAQQLRELAYREAGTNREQLKSLADDIAADAADLEAELIKSGYIPKAANQA